MEGRVESGCTTEGAGLTQSKLDKIANGLLKNAAPIEYNENGEQIYVLHKVVQVTDVTD